MTARTCRLMAGKHQTTLRLANERVTHYYLMRKQEGKAGDSYTLTRPDDSGGAITYVVWFFRHGGKPWCDCPDATYRGARRPCKHVAALQALRARGLV